MTTTTNFDYSVDILQNLLWEYDQAPALKSLLTQKQAWYNTNQKQFWIDWFNNVFNLNTANQFGLSVWAIILDQPIVINQVPDALTRPTFGFKYYSDSNNFQNFTHGNFSAASGASLYLSNAQKAMILKLRYWQLIGNYTIPFLNLMCQTVFGSLGKAYVIDNLNMTFTYVFTFQIPSDLNLLFTELDILPRPVGVKALIQQA